MSSETLTVVVQGMTCGHCKAAVIKEIGRVPGVETVDVDLETKLVVVTGTSDYAAVSAAVDEAGYEAVAAGTA